MSATDSSRSLRLRQNLNVFLIAFVLSFIAEAQPNPLARRVLILVNDSMRAEAGTGGVGASLFVGQYYAQKRGIPEANILHLKASTEETISYDEYLNTIEKPLKAFLEADGGIRKKQILYIVPTYGIPLKATVTSDLQGAVDSLIAGMYASKPDNLTLRVVSPYAAATGSRPPRFSSWSTLREASGLWKMFIVSRLDGPARLSQRDWWTRPSRRKANCSRRAAKLISTIRGLAVHRKDSMLSTKRFEPHRFSAGMPDSRRF